jgi:hypothetical protein
MGLKAVAVDEEVRVPMVPVLLVPVRPVVPPRLLELPDVEPVVL